MIETTDVIFAVDSIPAVMGITLNPFIVYASNICAILGLRSLYFALTHPLHLFHYLDTGIAIVLGFIGFKMLLEPWIHFPTWATLLFVATILGSAILLSIRYPSNKT